MSKIFILDDQKERHQNFQKLFEGHVIVSTYDAESAVRELASNTFDYIYLDHDLNSVSNENSGYFVAKWIASNYNNKKVNIIIHSFNIIGAENMGNVLRDNKFINVFIKSFPCVGYRPENL